MAAHAPSFRYHPTEAPAGKLFQTHDELDALDASWVDTPAAFALPPSAEVEPPAADPIGEALTPLRKKRKAKD